MFGNRRRRAASNPPLNGSNANPSAASAAAQAFLKSQASTASLSSAAAATALRSRPTTPTSVAEVQTKRMIRRAGSTSSVGSNQSAGSNRGPPGSQLQRRGSGGSMSERTFRDPSPNRSSPVPSAIDAPPVPAIPKNLNHRRAASLQPEMRVASPTPNRATGRGSSLQPAGSTAPRKAGQRNSMSSVAELTRPESRGSVNYSYPINARPMSPLANILLTPNSPSRAPVITSPDNQNLIYDPNTRRFLPAAQVHAIEQRLMDAANEPVKKQKRIAPKQAEGTHLADGTVGGRPRGTAVDSLEAARQPKIEQEKRAIAPEQRLSPTPEPAQKTAPRQVPSVTPEPAPITTGSPRTRKKRVTISDSGSDVGSNMGSDTESDASSRPAYTHRSTVSLTKKPSIVREDRQREEEEDDTPKRASYIGGAISPDNRTVSPTPAPRSAAGRGYGRGQASASAAFAQDGGHTRSISQPAPTVIETATPTTNGNGHATNGSLRGGRVQSVSPTRTAHFSTTPENLAIKHQPPGRSVSPRKSALKHSPSTRDESPGAMPGGFQGGSEVSDNSVASEEPLKPRKKSVRVSFDDESTVVVGQAAPTVTTDSPVVQSSQTMKRPWFSIGRGKKKDMQVMEDEGDEAMKPRPALPSFGSIREKKSRELATERPLVKPAEPLTETARHTPPLHAISTDEAVEFPLGQSSDQVVGTVLSQDSSSRNTANISKSREPLPPEVTSVEGSGYVSDSSSSYSLEDKETAAQIPPANIVEPGNGDVESPRGLAQSSEQDTAPEGKTNGGPVPVIAVLPATPKSEDANKQWPSMPGSWEVSSDSSSQEPSPIITAEHHATDPTLADIGIAEPTPEVQPAGIPVGEIAAAQYHHGAIIEETEESDSSSIYSDAAEDLSDAEGDGFMSLDAVVESPIGKPPGLDISTSGKTATLPESPTVKIAKERAYRKSKLSQDDEEPEMDEGWDKAQQYWSGLTAEKKRHLEQEAREEAEASEEEVTPVSRPKKSKKVAVKAPEESAEQRQSAPKNYRTYMIPPGSRMGPDGRLLTQPVLPKKSALRTEPAKQAAETHMRKSMRSSGSSSVSSFPSNSMRSSMREAPTQPKGSLQKKFKPVSVPSNEINSDPVAVSNHIRALSASSAALAQRNATENGAAPSLRRTGSGDSDSSFKRARAKPDGSKFRGSMRGSVEERNQSPMRSSRFSLRSPSPASSTIRRPFGQNAAAAPPVSMRPSLRENRNSFDSGTSPSLRFYRAKSPSGSGILGFSRPSSKQAASKPARSLGSRFADSDSEDERPAFRSRFADSDSEDDGPVTARAQSGFGRGTMRASAPTPRATPIRPIPSRKGLDEGDSSDLPDSDDEKSPALPPAKTPSRATNGNKTGTAQGTGSLRRSGSGRGTISPTTVNTPARPKGSHGSFMNSILRRKKADPNSKVRKSDAESAARRDTPLERSKNDLAALHAPSGSTASRPMSPKLQKRNPMSRENSSSWPLPDAPPRITTDDDRPATSDGIDEKMMDGLSGDGRPDLGTRRFTATGLSAVDVMGAPDTPRKKKKFQALRKMFRLDD